MGPEASATELLAALASGATSALALTEAALARIRAVDGHLGAWLRTDEASALETAARIDRRRELGQPLGPLAGLPVGVKDMICTRGMETTASSRILEGFVPPYDATVVERLRAADAIVLGKLAMDEFAMGSSSERSLRGPVRNPWDLERVPGGSSGGSAVALASGTCPLTLGTDTGGSIRQPAAFCGVAGLKPTYGRVSRQGVIAYASSLDQVGPMARSVRDLALLLQVIAGHDPRDATSLPDPVPDYQAVLDRPVDGLRVGVPAEYFQEGLDPAVELAVRAAEDTLRGEGAVLVPVSLPHTRYAIAAYYLIATAEASSNLARYDGVRYGHRTAEPTGDIDTLYSRTRAEGFGPEVKRRIILGTFALSSGYYDAYYLRAQKVRTLVRRDFAQAFERCDVICGPTSPVGPWRIGERSGDPLAMYLTDIYTVPANLAGLPCLSVPCGVDSSGMPVGLQLIGPPLGEATLLGAAHAFERATGHAARRPPEVHP
ncbi:MAG: Asp-tRNA(Asn)/Glu-tRNA(Gln) amidotransferase subunit GatA [Deltaproteobacteria bacterium]|nr:Asp-tRNA(Asn)/Glu-tRNA(Gln) amidotransferase subunit GatA [Deltaproteobacteria bacterium]